MSQTKVADGPEEQRQATKKSEAEIVHLEEEIEDLRKRLKLSQSEDRAEMEEKEIQIKKNREMIRELNTDIERMRIRLQQGKLGDEQMLKKAFQKYPGEMGVMKGKKVQEVIDVLEDRVFDMSKKREALHSVFEKRQKKLENLKREIREIERRYEADENVDHEYVHRAREVENEFEQASLKIVEMQHIAKTYEKIRDNLALDLMTLPTKLDELENQFHRQQTEIDRLIERKNKADQAREKAKIDLQDIELASQNARQEKDKVMAEFSQVLEQKQAHTDPEQRERRATVFAPVKREAEDELNHMKEEQEKQLEQFSRMFEEIKLATGVTVIEDVEKRFESQKAIRKNMEELKEHSEKLLCELKKEELQLKTQKEILLSVKPGTPLSVLEAELDRLKEVDEEMKMKKEVAEAEHERVTKSTAKAKSSLWHILQMMEYHILGEVSQSSSTMPDISISKLVDRVKDMLQQVASRLQGKDVATLMKEMKEKQPFLKKLEEEKWYDAKQERKPKIQIVEEENSSDEDVRKRSELKKEAQSFADVKQKQKGRGRGFKM